LNSEIAVTAYMPETSNLDRRIHLQQRTKPLYSHALDDIRQFIDKNNGVTFRRLTDSAMTDRVSLDACQPYPKPLQTVRHVG